MSRTNHPRIPGTHRALTKAHRVDIDWEGDGIKSFRQRQEGKAEIHEALTDVMIAARLTCDEPAATRECDDLGYGLGTMPKPSPFDRWAWEDDEPEVSPYDLEPEERMALLSKALFDMDTLGEPWAERLADWEYDLLLLADQTGVTYSEYADEFLKRAQAVDELVWSSEIDDADVQAELEQIRMEEAEYDDDFDGYTEDDCWLPLVTLYDPTGAVEDCYDVFGGDGFIIEGPSRADRPSTKTERDEWTVTSLARAWDVETSVMVEYLQDPAMANQSGLTASSRVPMHVITDRMSAEACPVAPKYTRMHLFRCLVLGHTESPMSRRCGAAARRPDAKRRKGEEEYAYRMGRLAQQWREVALTDECDSGCKVEVNALDQTRVVHTSAYGCRHPEVVSQPHRWSYADQVTTSRPHRNLRPNAPRPGSNPFTNRY